MFLKIKTYKAKCMFLWFLIVTILFVGSSLVLAEEKSQDIQKIESKEIVRNISKKKIGEQINKIYKKELEKQTGKHFDNEKVEEQINKIIEKQIDEEIKTYKNRAKEVFEFDDTLIEKTDKEILCYSLMQLNYLFDKYEYFTKYFIEYKKKNNSKFKLQVGTDLKDDVIMAIDGLDILHFSSKRLSNREECRISDFSAINCNFSPYYSLVNWAESHITHEFGHLIENMYIASINGEELKHKKDEVNRKNKEWMAKNEEMNRKLEECMFEVKERQRKREEYEHLLEEVVRLGNEYFCLKDEYSHLLEKAYVKIQNEILDGLEGKARSISRYGDTSPSEFFAEAFLHLECTDQLKYINEIGKRLENYLVNVMEYLPKENSKFNK